jgi:hypothetical protein
VAVRSRLRGAIGLGRLEHSRRARGALRPSPRVVRSRSSRSRTQPCTSFRPELPGELTFTPRARRLVSTRRFAASCGLLTSAEYEENGIVAVIGHLDPIPWVRGCSPQGPGRGRVLFGGVGPAKSASRGPAPPLSRWPRSSRCSRYSGSSQAPLSKKNSPFEPKWPTCRTESTTPPPLLTMFMNAVKVPWAEFC